MVCSLAAAAGIDPNYPDLNGDQIINFADFAIMANNWMETGTGLAGDFDNNLTVDFNDLYVITYRWLEKPPIDLTSACVAHYKLNDNDNNTAVVDSQGLSNGILNYPSYSYTVAGALSPYAMGGYTQKGTYGGKPRYKLAVSSNYYYLQWETNAWYINITALIPGRAELI
jgi:hypothetical protein